MADGWRQRRLRVPAEDGGTFIDPAGQSLPTLVAENRHQLHLADITIAGKRLFDLASSARHRLVDAAKEYTGSYADVSSDIVRHSAGDLPPLILAGHQPQLFHPGVWYKNFALARVAAGVGAVAINLVIDNDLCRAPAVRVPSGSVDAPRLETIAYDRPADDCPYEDRRWLDADTFCSFAQRVSDTIRPLVDRPLVSEYWTHVLSRQQDEPNLGRCLSQGRHLLEQQWWERAGQIHTKTLEIPQSHICQLPEFNWFAADLLGNLRDFVTAHNAALDDYRQAHGLRNRAQPLPNLARGDTPSSDGWWEAPFWIWTSSNPSRQAVFVRRQDHTLLLGNGRDLHLRIEDADKTSALQARLLELNQQGVRLRTRALTTTLFARLLLADMFIHGIGGAKYDEVTDRIIRSYYGWHPPLHAVVSATFRLPIEHPRVTKDDCRRLTMLQRQMTFNPQRFLGDDAVPATQVSNVESLVAEKLRWVETTKTVKNAKRRHDAIQAANQALQPYLAERWSQLAAQLQQAKRQRRASALFESREYAFCLFPAAHLRPVLLDSWTVLPYA